MFAVLDIPYHLDKNAITNFGAVFIRIGAEFTKLT
jgi:hypothetical protein